MKKAHKRSSVTGLQRAFGSGPQNHGFDSIHLGRGFSCTTPQLEREEKWKWWLGHSADLSQTQTGPFWPTTRKCYHPVSQKDKKQGRISVAETKMRVQRQRTSQKLTSTRILKLWARLSLLQSEPYFTSIFPEVYPDFSPMQTSSKASREYIF